MAHRTPQEHAYAALHEDYINGLITRDAYLAGFRQINGPPGRWRRLLAWLLALAVALILVAIYAAQIGAF